MDRIDQLILHYTGFIPGDDRYLEIRYAIEQALGVVISK